MLTVAEILTIVKERAGYVSRAREEPEYGPTDAQDNILIDFLNDALTRIAQTNRLKGTIEWETEADVYDYTIPDGVRSIRELWLDGEKLEQRDGLWVRLQATAGVEGSAEYWGVDGARFYLDKTPTEDGTPILLHVTYSEAYPVGDSDDILAHLPHEYRGPLIGYVLAEWWRMVGATDLIASNELAFERGLRLGETDPMAEKHTARTYRGL